MLAVLSTASSAAASTFYRLGFLGNTPSFSSAQGVSADGSVVTGYSWGFSDQRAFRWTIQTGMNQLPAAPGGSRIFLGYDVSDDGGVIVGEFSHIGGTDAFQWTAATGTNTLGDLAPLPNTSIAYGISGDGTIIVGGANLTTPFSGVAFRHTAATGMVPLGQIADGYHSTARAISDNNQVIVGEGSHSTGTQAFRWTEATGVVGLGYLNSQTPSSAALAVSADGSIVAGQSRNGANGHAFRWTAATGMVQLDDLSHGVLPSVVNAMTADGHKLYGESYLDGVAHAFIWDSVHGMRILQDVLLNEYGLSVFAGWRLERVFDVSPDGLSIVGDFRNSLGQNEAFLVRLTPVPEPATVWLAIAALSLLGLARCRHSRSIRATRN